MTESKVVNILLAQRELGRCLSSDASIKRWYSKWIRSNPELQHDLEMLLQTALTSAATVQKDEPSLATRLQPYLNRLKSIEVGVVAFGFVMPLLWVYLPQTAFMLLMSPLALLMLYWLVKYMMPTIQIHLFRMAGYSLISSGLVSPLVDLKASLTVFSNEPQNALVSDEVGSTQHRGATYGIHLRSGSIPDGSL